MSLFELDYVDRIARNVYSEFELSLAGSNPAIVRRALNVPIAVAGRATQLRALDLAGRMLTLFTAAQDALLRSESTVRDSLLDWSFLRLHEYGRGFVEPLIEDESSDLATRTFGKDALLQLFRTYSEIAKTILDHDPTDERWLGEVNRYWDEYLRHWRPQDRGLAEWELTALDERYGPNSPEVRDARERVAEAAAQGQIRDEIDRWRSAHRLALCMWVARNLRRSSDERWVSGWRAFAGYLGSVDHLLRAFDTAVHAASEDRLPWSQWVHDALPRTATYGVHVELELAQAFVLRALELIDPHGPPPELEPLRSAAEWIESAEGLVTGVVEEATFRPLLPVEDLAARTEVLIAALSRMRRSYEVLRDEQLAAKPLEAEPIDEFESLVRRAWSERRLARALCVAADAYDEREGRPDNGIGFLVEAWQSKSLFVREGGMTGIELIAEDLTNDLARGESEQFLRALDGTPRSESEPGASPADELRRAMRQLRGEGFEPSAILCSWDWELSQTLELDASVRYGGDAEPPMWVPPGEIQAFRGCADGIPVFMLDTAHDRTVTVVSLPHLGTWRQWTIDEGQAGLLVTVRDFAEDEAREMVARDPDFELRSSNEVDDQVRRIRTSVVVRLFEYFEFEISEPRAARRLVLPRPQN